MQLSVRWLGVSVGLTIVLLPSIARAAIISNGLTPTDLGYLSVDVTTGGESRDADFTANLASGGTITENVLFDYFTYIDVGQGGFRLSGSTPTGDSSQVSSNGNFTGSLGNTIEWSVVSAIAAGSSLMTNTFTLSAADGSLGELSLSQYMDEDLDSVLDDIFLSRGSAADADLELFTIDNPERYGVSHGGAYNDVQGLANASFAGWAVGEYNDMKPQLASGTQNISLTGFIDDGLSSFSDPDLGLVYGPADIVSVLSWTVDPDAQTATIITTLGGVPDANDIDDPESVPEPATTLGLLLLSSLGIGTLRRQVKAV